MILLLVSATKYIGNSIYAYTKVKVQNTLIVMQATFEYRQKADLHEMKTIKNITKHYYRYQ